MAEPSELRRDRDEIQRCLTALGWSWATLSERVGITVAAGQSVRTLKRGLPLSDIEWLQRLAEAMRLMPRPEPAGGRRAPASVADGATETEEQAMAVHDQVVEAIVELYAGSDELGDGAPGARHVLGQLADRMGCLDDVRARLRARVEAEWAAEKAAATPAAIEPPAEEIEAGGGTVEAGNPEPTAMEDAGAGRVPFSDSEAARARVPL